MIHYFTIRDGMLVIRIKRYNAASADMLRKQLDRSRIGYSEAINSI